MVSEACPPACLPVLLPSAYFSLRLSSSSQHSSPIIAKRPTGDYYISGSQRRHQQQKLIAFPMSTTWSKLSLAFDEWIWTAYIHTMAGWGVHLFCSVPRFDSSRLLPLPPFANETLCNAGVGECHTERRRFCRAAFKLNGKIGLQKYTLIILPP